MKTSPLKSIVNLCIVVVIVGSLFELAKKHNYSIDKFKQSAAEYADSYDKEHKLGKYGEVSDVKSKKQKTKVKPKQKKDVVYVHGFGDYNLQDLEIVCEGIENFWGFEAKVGREHSNPSSNYFNSDGYVVGFDVLDLVDYDGDGRHVYVTNHPICASNSKPELISGYARYYHKGAIVSTYQMTMNGNYNVNSLQSTANHEIGHNLDLEHCEDQNCMMKSHGLDSKEFCNNCKRKLNQ